MQETATACLSPSAGEEVVPVLLRGRVLVVPIAGRMQVGQPGIYSAAVFIDAGTRLISGGQTAELDQFTWGRAVLVKGFRLPAPAAFQACSIELAL